MDRGFKIIIRGIIGAVIIALLTICSLFSLFYLAPDAMFSRWHTVASLLGSSASTGVMLWSFLAQGRQGQSEPPPSRDTGRSR